MTTSIRPLADADLESADTLGLPAHLARDRNGWPVLVLVNDDDVVLGWGGIDPHGPPSEPDAPLLLSAFARNAGEDDRAALIESLIDVARFRGVDRLLIGCDPLDHTRLKRLEALGFRPAGRGPYFTLGSEVQYVTGYQDAAGSTLDLELVIEE